jgi:hypothetical protein
MPATRAGRAVIQAPGSCSALRAMSGVGSDVRGVVEVVSDLYRPARTLVLEQDARPRTSGRGPDQGARPRSRDARPRTCTLSSTRTPVLRAGALVRDLWPWSSEQGCQSSDGALSADLWLWSPEQGCSSSRWGVVLRVVSLVRGGMKLGLFVPVRRCSRSAALDRGPRATLGPPLFRRRVLSSIATSRRSLFAGGVFVSQRPSDPRDIRCSPPDQTVRRKRPCAGSPHGSRPALRVASHCSAVPDITADYIAPPWRLHSFASRAPPRPNCHWPPAILPAPAGRGPCRPLAHVHLRTSTDGVPRATPLIISSRCSVRTRSSPPISSRRSFT